MYLEQTRLKEKYTLKAIGIITNLFNVIAYITNGDQVSKCI